jgi:haloalkane dehalogenase
LRVVEAGLSQLSDRPALIVWGRRDFVFGEGEAARFAKLFPRNTLIFYDDASHFSQEDVGERIALRNSPGGCIDRNQIAHERGEF